LQSTHTLTLADAVFPRVATGNRTAEIARDVALMVGFALFVGLCAQISIRTPWTTVPITLQTYAVLVAGGSLGMARGAGSMGIYMLLGMIGIPLFAPGSEVVNGNWDVHFILPWEGSNALVWDISSAGYIVGFILSAALVGFLCERQWDRKPWAHLAMVLGAAVLYIPGLLWLGYLIDTNWIYPGTDTPLAEFITGDGTLDKTLKGGLYPFIVGDMMKLGLASLTLPFAWMLLERKKGGGDNTPSASGS
jgi:biotin transport system substrate-specific component